MVFPNELFLCDSVTVFAAYKRLTHCDRGFASQWSEVLQANSCSDRGFANTYIINTYRGGGDETEPWVRFGY